MSGDPCRPQAQGNRCDRRSVRPLHPRGVPAHIRSDNGPEFVAKAVQDWIAIVGAKTAYIERGSPWENGYIESFNARLRDELLDGEIFYTLREAQIVIESWRRHYNTIRPHASLGYKPPAPEVFVPAFAAWPAALRPTGSVGHAGATANLKLTFLLDHSVGADQRDEPGGVATAPDYRRSRRRLPGDRLILEDQAEQEMHVAAVRSAFRRLGSIGSPHLAQIPYVPSDIRFRAASI